MNVLRAHQATDTSTVGGKAAALSDLAAAGFDPPAFFVVLPGQNGGAGDGLQDELARIGPGPFAVRSSAPGEDGATLSHAGQYRSELNVTADDLHDSIARVAASGDDGPAGTYRALRGAGATGEPIAVIVQQMVVPRLAGIAFSADPVSGRRDRVVVSATPGLADGLANGEIDGETWILDAEAIVEAPADPAMTPAEARSVAELARRAEAHFGAPQDIEWAIDADGLHILQSRPITAGLKPAPHPDAVARVLDNSNIVESYPGIVSALTYSFAVHVYSRVYRAFVRLLGVREADIAANAAVFDNMLARVDGRVYYDLVNWYRALAMLPGFSLNRGYMETMMGVSEPLPADIVAAIAPPPASLGRKVRDTLRLARVAAGLVAQAILLPRTRRRFGERLEGALGSGLDLSQASLGALAREYRTIEADLLDRWDAPLINDFLCMIAFGASRNLMIRWLGESGAMVHNDVLIGQGDIISAEPARRIVGIAGMVRDAALVDALHAGGLPALDGSPAIRDQIDAYLARFGDRCVQELKLESIPLKDDPAPLVAAIVAQARAPGGGAVATAETDWQSLFRGRPVRRWLARRLLAWTRARVRDRENLRFERTRIFGHARRVFLAMGREMVAHGLLDDPRDVLHLTVGEVLAIAEGAALSTDAAALAGLRRGQDAASARRPDPPERLVFHGPVPALAADPAASPSTDTERQGTGCSAGRVAGTARVVTDPRTQTLEPGQILVARHTDPGWIALFAGVAAIVVERGSLLSHSAIVARELGVPCVVGLRGATDWIRDGETIHVDGAAGVVRRTDG